MTGELEARDSKAKMVGATAVLLYSVGLLIENVHLNRFGVANFAALRPRFVLVGAVFVLYLAIPFLAVGLPVVAAARFHDARKKRFQAIAMGVFSFIVVAILMPVPFHYFISSLDASSSLTASLIPFWKLYADLLMVNVTLTLYLGLIVTLAPWMGLDHRSLMAVREHAAALPWILIAVGSATMIVPFVINVFPNVDYAVGGGRPPVIRLVFKEDPCLDSAERRNPESSDDSDPAYRQGKLLLWHQSEDFFFVTPVKAAMEGDLPVTAVAKDLVRTVEYLGAFAGFFEGKRLVPWPDKYLEHREKSRPHRGNDAQDVSHEEFGSALLPERK